MFSAVRSEDLFLFLSMKHYLGVLSSGFGIFKKVWLYKLGLWVWGDSRASLGNPVRFGLQNNFSPSSESSRFTCDDRETPDF